MEEENTTLKGVDCILLSKSVFLAESFQPFRVARRVRFLKGRSEEIPEAPFPAVGKAQKRFPAIDDWCRGGASIQALQTDGRLLTVAG